MKLGILGGTFDPIHIGHLRVAVEAFEAFELDQVVLEVVNENPLKARVVTDGLVRAEMAAGATAGLDGVVVGTRELERTAPSYTVDTMEAYAREGHELWLVLGSDALAQFDRWREPERILEVCRLAVAARPGVGVSEAMRGLPAAWMRRVDVFDCRPIDLSSTEIRAKVRAGRSIQFLTPDKVVQFIAARRLYV